MPFQRDLAREAELHQSRISMFETPGMSNMTLETLAKVGAGLRCGVIVRFVPFSEMLAWENSFSPEEFDVLRLNEDVSFTSPETEAGSPVGGVGYAHGNTNRLAATCGTSSTKLAEEALGALPTRIPPMGAQLPTEIKYVTG